jgi:hypothetical protein
MNAIDEMEPKMRSTHIIVRVTEELRDRMKAQANKRHVKVAWLVRFILLDWLDEQSVKGKRRKA